MNFSENNVIQQIENDEFYQSFFKSTTRPQTMVISDQVKKLSEGIALISQELQKQVLEKHDDLLRQGNHATKLENVLNTMNSHVQNLFANAERLRNQINGPFNAMETHTKVLGRLHLASHILRQVNRIQHLSKRLANTSDPVQKASILHELEQLAADEDLMGIEAVTTELRNIRAQQQKVVKMATASLNQGIINENGAQTNTALQIFINLGIIQATLDNFLDLCLAECRDCLKSAFEASANKAPGRVNLVSSQGFRNRVWTELEKAFVEEIYRQSKQVKFLQTTLDNIQDLDAEIAREFWTKLGLLLQEEIANSSAAIRQMLEEDYPKLVKFCCDLSDKLKSDLFKFDRQVLEKCENSYLSNSLTRLLDPTQQMFSEVSPVPNHDQIDTLIRSITSELSVALIEENLNEKMCKSVSKCIKMFAVKTEQQLETGQDAAQVIAGTPNSGQLKNVQFANSLYYFHTQILRILLNMRENLSENGSKLIYDSLESLTNLTGAIIQPLVDSINTTVETIIVTIHLETDWGKLQSAPVKTNLCSPYMRELCQFLTRVHQTYLTNFNNKDVLTGKCSEIAVRSIELLVRHSALLRPLSQGGRQRLHVDYLQLEHTLKAICPQLTDLGRPYRLLKSMAHLIQLSPSEIVASQVSDSSVPHSTVLLMLFAYATETELASPHQNTGWTVHKISRWLDEHTMEQERLDLIAGALQRYERIVRQKNSVSYDPVYPVMSKFLEKVLGNCK